MELVLAFQLAQAALSGIRSCCSALSEGKVEIQRIKKGIGDAKDIAQEVWGLWKWLSGFFSGAKPLAQEQPQPTAQAQKAKKKTEEYTDYIPTVDDVSEQFFGHLIDFMEAQAIILDDIESRREILMNVFNPKQNNRTAAAKLIKDERKINQMALEFSSMLSGAPRELGAVYTDFKAKYPVVVQAQERAKERQRILRQQESWQRERAHNDKVDLAMVLGVTAVFLLELWAVWISLFTGEF